MHDFNNKSWGKMSKRERRHATEKTGNSHRRKKKRNKGHTQEIKSTVGVIRGFVNEELVASALGEKFKKPHWYVSFKRASGQEDCHQSTDFFIHTYLCDVRIDVKSSAEYAREKEKSLSHLWMKDVIVIVVKPFMTSKEIRENLFSEVERYLKFKFGSRTVRHR